MSESDSSPISVTDAEGNVVSAKLRGRGYDVPKATLDFFGGDELAARCFIEKYALKGEDGELVETLPTQMWERVSREMASVEKDDRRVAVQQSFYDLLAEFRFIPGGRILYGAGNGKKATLTNCYYTDVHDDSLDGIFQWCKDAAKTYAFGGGNGVDVGRLRPKGAPVTNSAGTSSGAVSFMELFSTTTGTVGQHGRRGALMISMPVTHPDIEEFVDIKKGNTTKVRYANISVKITDDFMAAAKAKKPFTLSFTDKFGRTYRRQVDAARIWDKIIESAHASAEPGILFWDNVKRESPSEYCAPVSGTNPCGEQALESNGACTLGHINLARYVLNPFATNAVFDWSRLEADIYTAVRFLDNVVEYNLPLHAHEAQAAQAFNTRRVGMGVTALADALVMLGVKYDGDKAIETVAELMEFIRDSAYGASSALAAEKGVFPLFNATEHLARPFVARLPESLKNSIRQHGLRNVCILTVAPVGSGSTLTQTSSGIEPIFALTYKRRSESLSREWYDVAHALVERYCQSQRDAAFPSDLTERLKCLPDTFVASHQIDPFFRVKMQATIQKFIDSAISSTVNLPRDVSVETVKRIYEEAHAQGVKGITVYREGSREGILITEGSAKPTIAAPEAAKAVAEPVQRGDVLDGKTHKIRTPDGAMYVTVNTSGGKPLEVFALIGKSGGQTAGYTEAIGRLASLALRSGVDVAEVVDQLHGIRGPDAVMAPGGSIRSVPDAIARVLSNYVGDAVRLDTIQSKLDISKECRECGGEIRYEAGCSTCTNCASSKCG